MSEIQREQIPNTGEQLPQPVEGLEKQLEKAKEAPSDGGDSVGKKQPQKSLTLPPDSASSAIPAPTVPGSDKPASDTSGAATSDLPAEDVDLIEKQWVERAKALVEKTQNDPYIQKNEMSKVKADYIKKRFNKSIPTDDMAGA